MYHPIYLGSHKRVGRVATRDALMNSTDTKPRGSRATATAIAIGIFYPLLMTAVLGLLLGTESLSYTLLLYTGYGILGTLLAFIWPDRAWQSGLYLTALWILLFPAAILFSDPIPWTANLVLRDFAWHAAAVVIAFVGVIIGRLAGNSSGGQTQLHP
jgi:hypothetical protein